MSVVSMIPEHLLNGNLFLSHGHTDKMLISPIAAIWKLLDVYYIIQKNFAKNNTVIVSYYDYFLICKTELVFEYVIIFIITKKVVKWDRFAVPVDVEWVAMDVLNLNSTIGQYQQ